MSSWTSPWYPTVKLTTPEIMMSPPNAVFSRHSLVQQTAPSLLREPDRAPNPARPCGVLSARMCPSAHSRNACHCVSPVLPPLLFSLEEFPQLICSPFLPHRVCPLLGPSSTSLTSPPCRTFPFGPFSSATRVLQERPTLILESTRPFTTAQPCFLACFLGPAAVLTKVTPL